MPALLGQASIVLEQSGLPPLPAGRSRNDGAIGTPVNVRNADNTNVKKWRWELAKPRASAATLSSTQGPTTSFTPDTDGTYLLRLYVNEGKAVTQRQIVLFAVKSLAGIRYPAQGEAAEATWPSVYTGLQNETGWWEDMDEILRANQSSINGSMVTAVAEPALPNSRELAAGPGITLTDNGPGSTLEISAALVAGVEALDDQPGNPENLRGVKTDQPPTRSAADYGQVNLGSEAVAGKGTKANYATIAGGLNNLASGVGSAVLGGQGNTASGADAVAVGGSSGTASGDRSATVGGLTPTASGARAFVGAGDTGIASNTNAAVVAGHTNTASGVNSAVVAGDTNTASGTQAVVLGGNTNQAQAEGNVIGGGSGNLTSASNAGVLTGSANSALGIRSAVVAGQANSASGQNSGVVAGDTGTASGLGSFVGAGDTCTASGTHAVVVGGELNGCSGIRGFVGAGTTNLIGVNTDAVICGGANNSTGDDYTAILGGSGNGASGPYSTCVGGNANTSGGTASFVGGGASNSATADHSTIAGGAANSASGNYSSALAGRDCSASATDSHALGRSAQAGHSGSMVLKDGGATTQSSTVSNELTLRFDGGIRLVCSGAKITRRLGTSTNNYSEVMQGQQSTTDGVAQFVSLVTVPTNGDVTVRGVLKGKRSGSADQKALAFWADYTNNGGVVALTGGAAHLSDTKNTAGAAGWVAAVGISGTAIQLQFTGAAATTIRWTWEFEVHYGGQT